jgi:hypothetical protein
MLFYLQNFLDESDTSGSSSPTYTYDSETMTMVCRDCGTEEPYWTHDVYTKADHCFCRGCKECEGDEAEQEEQWKSYCLVCKTYPDEWKHDVREVRPLLDNKNLACRALHLRSLLRVRLRRRRRGVRSRITLFSLRHEASILSSRAFQARSLRLRHVPQVRLFLTVYVIFVAK